MKDRRRDQPASTSVDRWRIRAGYALLLLMVIGTGYNTRSGNANQAGLRAAVHRLDREQTATNETQKKLTVVLQIQAQQTTQIKDLIATRGQKRDDAMTYLCGKINNTNRGLLAAARALLTNPDQIAYFTKYLGPIDCTSSKATGAK